jgi:hypothetical protein
MLTQLQKFEIVTPLGAKALHNGTDTEEIDSHGCARAHVIEAQLVVEEEDTGQLAQEERNKLGGELIKAVEKWSIRSSNDGSTMHFAPFRNSMLRPLQVPGVLNFAPDPASVMAERSPLLSSETKALTHRKYEHGCIVAN